MQSEGMKQILIVEDDSFLNKMLAYNLTADSHTFREFNRFITLSIFSLSPAKI